MGLQWIQDRAKNRIKALSEKIVEGRVKGKTLDEKALMLCKLLPMARGMPNGEAEVRTQFINGTESEIKELVETGKSDDEILQPCLDSPNYMKLLKELGLNIDHLKVMISDARKKLK